MARNPDSFPALISRELSRAEQTVARLNDLGIPCDLVFREEITPTESLTEPERQIHELSESKAHITVAPMYPDETEAVRAAIFQDTL